MFLDISLVFGFMVAISAGFAGVMEVAAYRALD
jgi:hypothetical protein